MKEGNTSWLMGYDPTHGDCWACRIVMLVGCLDQVVGKFFLPVISLAVLVQDTISIWVIGIKFGNRKE